MCKPDTDDLFDLLPGSGAGQTGLSVGVIVGITIASAAFLTLLIVLLVWVFRKCVERKQHHMLDYQSLHKYNSLVSFLKAQIVRLLSSYARKYS